MLNPAYRSLASLMLASSALCLPAAAPVMAQTANSAFPGDGTLPHTAIPSHYVLSIRPDAKAMTFTGTFAIDVDVPQKTDAIVLNAVRLTVDKASLVADHGATVPLTASYDAKEQTVRLAAAGGRHGPNDGSPVVVKA